jgi:hypothetical protein
VLDGGVQESEDTLHAHRQGQVRVSVEIAVAHLLAVRFVGVAIGLFGLPLGSYEKDLVYHRVFYTCDRYSWTEC